MSFSFDAICGFDSATTFLAPHSEALGALGSLGALALSRHKKAWRLQSIKVHSSASYRRPRIDLHCCLGSADRCITRHEFEPQNPFRKLFVNHGLC